MPKRRRGTEESEEDPERPTVRIKTEQELRDFDDDDDEEGGPPTPPVPRSAEEDVLVKKEINLDNVENEGICGDLDLNTVSGDPVPSTPSQKETEKSGAPSGQETQQSRTGQSSAQSHSSKRSSPNLADKSNQQSGTGGTTGPGSAQPEVKTDSSDGTQNREDEKMDEWTEEENRKKQIPPNVGNIFTFETDPLIRPIPPTAMSAEIEHVPLVQPKQAHYNTHAPDDELRYVNEGGKKLDVILMPNDKPGDDESEEEDEATKERMQKEGERLSRYYERNNVYTKYNFQKRNVDPSACAVYEMKQKILHTLENNRVVIIEGFTGCGKTTQVPQYILDKACEDQTFCNIVVTQPRKIAATSVAKRVCHERNWNVGSVVGYQVGMEDKRDKTDTLLTFMTTGVLLQKLISQKSLKEFTHIIIDEVHERDLESDFLLLIIKRIMASDVAGKERHVKLILMSATIDTKTFQNYFLFKSSDGELKVPPVVQIPYKSKHRVEEYYLDDILCNKMDLFNDISTNLDIEKATIPEDIYQIACSVIISLDELEKEQNPDPRMKNKPGMAKDRGAVLVFLPGMEEIKTLQRFLTNSCRNGEAQGVFYKWAIHTLHSSVTVEDQARVFDRPGDTFRKIILSTNIAESSVTVPDIAYVLDFCLTKSLCIDQTTNFTTLRMVWASKSQCVQRKGRAGRVADGKTYRLVPRAFYHHLEDQIIPEMRRSNLETIILMCKKFDLDTPIGLLRDALEPPNFSGIERAVSTLKELGALTITKMGPGGKVCFDTCDGDLTFVGQIMQALPIPQQCTRLILLGHCFGVMREAVIIAAGLSVKSPFQTGFGHQLETYLEKLRQSKKGFSDLFALYHVYKTWMCNYCEGGVTQKNRNAEYRWSRAVKVNLAVLREIKSTVELLEERLKKHGITETYTLPTDPLANNNPVELSSEQGLFLKLSIAGAFYPNYFLRRRPDLKQYEKDNNRAVNGNDVLRTIHFKGFPQEHIGKLYSKHVADWLSHGLSIPMIQFDGQKVFAIFDNSIGETIGPFSIGIFRAIKLRQLRNQSLEFKVLWQNKERPYLGNWENEVKRRRCTPCPPLRNLPPIDVRKVTVRVQHINSPTQFWVIVSQDFKQIENINKIIQEQFSQIKLPASKLFPNSICLAPFEGCYYRAKVLRIEKNAEKSLVYFIDYGNSLWVPNRALIDFNPYMTDQEIHKRPAMAIECRLEGVKPNIVHGLHWSEESTNMMRKFCDKAPHLEFEIFSIYHSVMVGRLIGYKDPNNKTQSCCANDLLVTRNESGKMYGEKALEPFLSMENNRKRNRSALMERSEIYAASAEQVGEPIDLDFIHPPEDGQQPVTLKGPWSPLEMNFQALVHCSVTKDVRIDNNSVNSVLLDHEPTTSTSRMLVASHIGVAERSKAVMIRDSSIMPPIPGILQLICMMFAPKIELRVDREITKYTGLLCGCGTVNTPDKGITPVHPDNDMEIVFDTEVDDDDINKINGIRYYLNHLLKQVHSSNKSELHKPLRDAVIRLVSRTRAKIDEEIWPQEEYVWNRISEDLFQPTIADGLTFSHDDIFQPHLKVKLNKQVREEVSWQGAY